MEAHHAEWHATGFQLASIRKKIHRRISESNEPQMTR
jgi:hypothetical protein